MCNTVTRKGMDSHNLDENAQVVLPGRRSKVSRSALVPRRTGIRGIGLRNNNVHHNHVNVCHEDYLVLLER